MNTDGSSATRGENRRPVARLRPQLDRNLVAYAGAAAAAGVGLLALVPAAEGKVIYKKVNKPISLNTILPLDLNQDGVTDFTFVDSRGSISFAYWGYLTIFPNYLQNRIMGPPGTWFFRSASALSAGQTIGGAGFSPGAKLLAGTNYAGARRKTPPASSSCFGLWKNVSDRFLGLKFRITGKVHYGWASLDVTCANIQVTGTLTGYAYETKPNTPILAGQKKEAETAPGRVGSGLGQLARGAVGMHK